MPEDKGVLWVCLAIWLLSFFLPTIRGDGFWIKGGSGFYAFVTSVIFFWVPIYGWVWPANIFVAIAPLYARRMEQGKGGTGYVIWMCVWSILPFAVPLALSLGFPEPSFQLEAGYYVWQLSLVGIATWFLWVTSRRRVVLVVSGLVTSSFFAGFMVVSMHRQVRAETSNLQAAIHEADDKIQSFEKTGSADLMTVPLVKDRQYLDPRDASLKDFNLAMVYMGDIYTYRNRERISDYWTLERYPGVPVHPAETAHAEPWMDYRDVQPAALARAKLYLRNAKIETGMIEGKKQLPALLSSIELGSPITLPTQDVPAHVSNLEGITQIWRGNRSVARVEADAVLQKGDRVSTGVPSKAKLKFADGTICIVESGSWIAVEENSINSAGRANVEARLESGKVVIETGTIAWGSKMQVDIPSNMINVRLDSQSVAELEQDSRGAAMDVLVKKGSAEYIAFGKEPIKLLEHERISLPGNGGRAIKSRVSEDE